MSAPIVSSTSQSVTISWREHQATCGRRHVTALRFLWREDACALTACPVYDSQSRLPMGPYIKQGLIDDAQYHDFGRDATTDPFLSSDLMIPN